MRYLRRIFISSLCLFVVPAVTHAVEWFPIVQCGSTGQNPCTPCDLFEAGKHVIDFVLLGLTGPIAAFMIVLAGGIMLVGGANPSTFSQGKKMLTNTMLGVGVILLAWVATNSLIKSLATGSTYDSWYQFTCPAFLSGIQQSSTLITPGPWPSVSPITFPEPADLAAAIGVNATIGECPPEYKKMADAIGVPCPVKNSQDLVNLAICIYGDPVVKALANPLPDLGRPIKQETGVVTYLNDRPVCNYTRGKGDGGCQHAPYSCHFGGVTGKQGAEAIDITARGGYVTIPDYGRVSADLARLFCEIKRVLITEASTRRCSFKLLNYEPTKNHIHISTSSCDSDGKSVGSVLAAKGSVLPGCVPLKKLSPTP